MDNCADRLDAWRTHQINNAEAFVVGRSHTTPVKWQARR
jgi:hypothetical protein